MSMTLRQIVDMADKRVSNAETDSDKVTVIDQLQRRLYRKFDLPEEVEQIETVEDQSIYTVPEYIVPSRIKSVVVTASDGSSPKEYSRKYYSDYLGMYCYYVIETENTTMIRVNPTPTESGGLININFEDSPNTLSSSAMSSTPRFFKDYHMLFVYSLCAELAKIRKDVALANNFTNDFQELLEEATFHINDNGPRQSQERW